MEQHSLWPILANICCKLFTQVQLIPWCILAIFLFLNYIVSFQWEGGYQHRFSSRFKIVLDFLNHNLRVIDNIFQWPSGPVRV